MYNLNIINRVIQHAQMQSRQLFSDNIDPSTNEYTYLITGEYGPSGKSHLTEELKIMGYNAMELPKNFLKNAFGFNIEMRKGVYEDFDNKIVLVVMNP